MTTLSTTIKQKYFDAIVSGAKGTEYKETSPFWVKRIDGKGLGLNEIVFICGRKVHRRQIIMIQKVQTEAFLSDIIRTPMMYAIHLGLEIKGNNKMKCKLKNRCADFDEENNYSCESETVAIEHCSYRQMGEFPDKLHPNKYALQKISSVLKFIVKEGSEGKQ